MLSHKQRREALNKEPKVERVFRRGNGKIFRKMLFICNCRDGGKGCRGGICSRCNKAILTHMEKLEHG